MPYTWFFYLKRESIASAKDNHDIRVSINNRSCITRGDPILQSFTRFNLAFVAENLYILENV